MWRHVNNKRILILMAKFKEVELNSRSLLISNVMIQLFVLRNQYQGYEKTPTETFSKYPISFLLKCQNNDWEEDYVYNELPKSHLDLQFTHKIINIMLI